VEGVLPTFYAASGLHWWDLVISLAFFLVTYTSLLVVMVWLLVRAIKYGPSETSVLDVNDNPSAHSAAIMEPAE